LPVLAEGERQIDQVIASYLGQNGILYLTDRRLLFEYSEGVIHKNIHQLGLSIREISTVNAKNPRLGGRELIISAKNPNNGFKTTQIIFKIAAIPEQWITKINNLLIPISSKASPNLVIEREVVKVPCKYCGTLIDVFRSNTCSQCGAPVR